MAICAGAKWLCVTNGQVIVMLDISSGRVLHCLEKPTAGVTAMAFTHQETRLVSAYEGIGITVWDLEAGALLFSREWDRSAEIVKQILEVPILARAAFILSDSSIIVAETKDYEARHAFDIQCTNIEHVCVCQSKACLVIKY